MTIVAAIRDATARLLASLELCFISSAPTKVVLRCKKHTPKIYHRLIAKFAAKQQLTTHNSQLTAHSSQLIAAHNAAHSSSAQHSSQLNLP